MTRRNMRRSRFSGLVRQGSHALVGLVVLVLAAGPARAQARGADAQLAGQVLDLAGVRTGLCVHLGCGRQASPGLTAELAAGSRLLVHGLALDDASLERARTAIETRGLPGLCLVEKVVLDPLPYLRDLVNLVVIEDFTPLAKQGLKMEEVQRIVAPGGVVCIRRDGRWTKTVKPRSKEMDDWTHPHHGPDGNMVSADKVVRFPIGFRWIDGLPMNINRWAACRAWVVAGGRLFTLSVNELENLGPPRGKNHFLAARDAFNGLPLWKINCETTDDGAFLTWINAGPLVACGDRVYAATKDKVIGVDAATGKVALTYATKYPATRLLLLDGVLVTACWEAKVASKAKFDRESLWATWVARGDVGSVQAFDAATGREKWSMDVHAHQILASGDVVYLLTQKGNPPTERTVVAVDLRTGKERWRVPHTRFGETCDLELSVAGKTYLVVAKRGEIQGLGAPKKDPADKPRHKAVLVLSAADGNTLWQISPATSIWTPVVEGLLWYGGKKHDPRTGEVKGSIGWGISDQACTPQAIVNNTITRTRGGQYIELPREGSAGGAKDLRFNGARGACMEGMVPANGMFYTAQNNCRCTPGQVYGFLAIGPSGDWPAAADFEKPRPVEKGPAFGAALEVEDAKNDDDWPTFRHDAGRTACTTAKLPEGLKELWKVQVARPGEGPVADAWKTRLASCLSAPVSAARLVFVAGTDAGQLVALDAATGKKAWSATLGGRIDTPPTIHRGLCLVGCHDGWVYALRAKDGQLAWRTRVAPWERRMVAYGEVESVWPAVGTVLVHQNVAYANAGRTSESDGGVAVVAFDPATGRQVWGKAIEPGPLRQNDMLCLRDGSIGWHHLRLDPKTGGAKEPAPVGTQHSQGGMMDGTWTVVGKRRSGNAFQVGEVVTDPLVWNDTLVVGPNFAIERAKASDPEAVKARTYLWEPASPAGCQVEAIALAANAVVYAGRLTGRQTGKVTGVLWVVSVADGRKIAEFPLDAPPTYDGLAVAGERVYVSLQNGSVICMGKVE